MASASSQDSTVSTILNSSQSMMVSSLFSQPHYIITVKLDDTNYSLWRAQFLPCLQGYELDGFFNGEKPCPSATLPNTTNPNPDFVSWKKQNRILLGWIFSSLTPAVLRHVHRLTTSREVWTSLESLFSSKYAAHVHHLQCELRALKKGSLSIRSYIDRARDIVDSLAVADTTVTTTKLRHCILAGMDSSYDPIVTSLTTSMAAMIIEDFITYLLTFELRLEQQHRYLSSQPVANVASFARFSASNPSSQQRQQTSGGASGGTRQLLPCQLCDKSGHPAHLCWKRFDQNLRPQPPRRQPSSPSLSSSAPRAYIAQASAPKSLYVAHWVPESGATDHITNDLSRLYMSSEYNGPDQVKLGNGTSIPISHVGSSILGTPDRSMYGEGSTTRL